MSDVDFGHADGIERQQFSLGAVRRAELDQIAGAEIMHRNHSAAISAGIIDRAQPDQIGVVKLIRVRRLRQTFARHIELGIGQPLGGVAIRDTGKLGDQSMFGRPQALDLEKPAVLGLERAV